MTSALSRPLRLLPLGLLLSASLAAASERQLTYTYTSDTLAPGTVELEPWTTARAGKDSFFFRLDQRLEVEAGVTDGFQVALYLNPSARLFDEGEGDARVRTSTFSWGGLSLEGKWKVMDAVADPFGLALYFEPTFAVDQVELEAKVIVDKRLGRLLLAANFVAEYEFEFEEPELHRELQLELDLGAAWQLTDVLSVGVEARNHNVSPVGTGWEHSALFAGPVVSLRSKSVWAAFSVMPQLLSLRGPSPDLDEHERLEARLLVGFHL